MKPDPDPTLADRIVESLAAEIGDGRLPPGERLRQNEIAVRFSASHVPVREAFLRLEALGLAVTFPRRGVRVAGIDAAQHFEAIEMRAVLEGLALRHAATHFPPGHLAVLAEADRACSQALSDEDWEAANHGFHRLLIAPCPMRLLLDEIMRLQARVRRGARLLGGQRLLSLPREDRDHLAILAALRVGDAEKAAALLTRHIRRGHLQRNL
ncbi:MAG TPA: GntR family transcriptional regulator [Albidovulum sp.]|uniref:GntR family transcriptional regulator n=1 Tax=Albidovulum sp. TaxID=1872424 RepID=UPI002C398DEC|nr:GntR family transcriptional regulator [Albidovulum sp.]